MKTVITNKKELASSVITFQRRIASLAHSRNAMEWAFPNAERWVFDTYSVATDLGELLVAVPKKWKGRQAHLFALNHSGGTLSPDVEINIPDGLDRNVSGAYARDGKSVLICHRGAFTAFRGRIPKDVSLSYFEKWLVAVEDDGKMASVISVASMESNSLANDIAEFVSAVSEMKLLVRSGELIGETSNAASNWNDGDEFEGTKTPGKPSPSKDYEYLHGPLCNALRRKLKMHFKDSPVFEVKRNKNIDVAIIDVKSNRAVAIFEVKTSASLSSQLYSARGQLAYYRHKYGGAATALFLVLPKEVEGEMNSLRFFRDEGIEVIYGERETFTSSSGSGLSKVLATWVS